MIFLYDFHLVYYIELLYYSINYFVVVIIYFYSIVYNVFEIFSISLMVCHNCYNKHICEVCSQNM